LAGGWAFGGHVPSAAELGELYVNTDLLGRRQPLHLTTAEALAPLHARAATRAPARAEITFTRLDAGGRLPVPLCPVVDVHLRAERDGAVLVVFLPDTAEAPRPGYYTPKLRVDPRGRLLLGPDLRDQLGLAAGATVITRADTDRRVLELMAASRIEPQLDDLFDAHRRGAPALGPALGLAAAPVTAAAG
jgi:hypothetical protein